MTDSLTYAEATTGRTYMPQSNETVETFLDTLTGFDEIAIAKHFDGLNPYTQGEQEPVMVLRALVFVDLRRGNEERARLSDVDAHQAAMHMPLGRAQAYFIDETTEEISPESMETPSGEGPAAVE